MEEEYWPQASILTSCYAAARQTPRPSDLTQVMTGISVLSARQLKTAGFRLNDQFMQQKVTQDLFLSRETFKL